MKVKIVSITRPVGDEFKVDCGYMGVREMTAEEYVVYIARVTSPHRQQDHDSAPRLLRYLLDKRHWSPFDMVDMTVEVETSRAISAQMLRHWSFDFQEFSQRYAKADMGYERTVARLQGSTNRQGSAGDAPPELVTWWDEAQARAEAFTEEIYNEALDRGVAKEQARMVLPLSVRTRLYMKGTVRSWIHYLLARLAPDAQPEHADIARAALPIFNAYFPAVCEATRLVSAPRPAL